MKKTMRRQRTRRGLKRRVRKNKTMRGGLWNISPITLDTFKKQGYAYAENTLYTSSQKVKGYELSKGKINLINLQKIKNDYNTYYNSLQEVDKKITKWVPDALAPNGARMPVNMFAEDNKTLLVEPKEFNEIIEYITSDSITKKKMPLLTQMRNQKYVDFGRSFITFINIKSGAGISSNLTGAAEGALNTFKDKIPTNVSGMLSFLRK